MSKSRKVQAVDDKYESLDAAIEAIEEEQGLHMHRIVYYIENGYVYVKGVSMSTRPTTYIEKVLEE